MSSARPGACPPMLSRAARRKTQFAPIACVVPCPFMAHHLRTVEMVRLLGRPTRDERFILIAVPLHGLDKSDLRIFELTQDPIQEIGRGFVIRIQHDDNFPSGGFQGIVDVPRLGVGLIFPRDVDDAQFLADPPQVGVVSFIAEIICVWIRDLRHRPQGPDDHAIGFTRAGGGHHVNSPVRPGRDHRWSLDCPVVVPLEQTAGRPEEHRQREAEIGQEIPDPIGFHQPAQHRNNRNNPADDQRPQLEHFDGGRLGGAGRFGRPGVGGPFLVDRVRVECFKTSVRSNVLGSAQIRIGDSHRRLTARNFTAPLSASNRRSLFTSEPAACSTFAGRIMPGSP